MDVVSWLRSLGLEQYEALFRENDIDAGVLGDLTDADLEKLGVTLGHRKRLLRAIAGLGATEPAAKPAIPAPLPLSTDAAERRPITVMFCDLVGSTSLAAKLDAEDWRNLVNVYLDQASAAVTDFGGHVLKRLGDGLMALFGYPQAQENDAERAVRAALAVQRALADLNARNARSGTPELSARIGVETGPVVVDATGEVFGDAPNVAARVQAAAEPGSVLITLNVQRQTAGLFVVEDKGAHDLKGVAAPIALYRVVRASGGGRRGGARALTPLVGREEELDLLTRRWERARKGEGQLALIVGEPGLGKSRLMEEFHGRLGETPHTWVEWSSSQLLQNTPMHPIADWGRQRFGADLPAEQRLADLENTLSLIGLDPTEYAPLLAPLVDVFLPEDRVAKLAPEELRRRQLAAMTAWILAAARTQAIVLAFEDLHWADPTSLDLMRALAERGAQAPLLVIATARPEFRAPWSVRSHHSVISLSPLDSVQIAKMVRDLSSRHALPRDIVDGVSERTGGVPLYVEEVTRLLLERGEQGGAQAIPPTLQQSLAARLDRLGAARETAQIGAVLGRGFSYALLYSVAGLDEGALQASLDRLAEADILFVEGDGAQATYRFKHALIQDAAYDSLLKSRRQALHRRAAEILRDSPERAAAEPEAIAHHFTEAGLDDLAIEWWGKAGDQALRRSAFPEAIAHLRKAIEMADKGAGEAAKASAIAPAPTEQRLKLQTSYGQAIAWSKGFAAEETKAVLAQTLGLAAQSDNVAERMKAHYARWVALFVGGELESAHEAAEVFLREAKLAGDAPAAGSAGRALGQTCLWQGRFAEAREHLREALRVYSPCWEASLRRQHGSDFGISAKAYLAMVAWHVGDAIGATAQFDEASTEALASEHSPTIANTYWIKAAHEMGRGDAEATLRAAKVQLDVSERSGARFYESMARMFLSWARARLGAADGLAQFRGHGETIIGQGAQILAPLFHGRLAELEAEQMSVEKALNSIDRSIELAREGDNHYIDALLHRTRGDILLRRDPANATPAVEAYLAASAVAREQGARSLGLQAALKLAKLYQSTGRLADAHTVLAPALDGFAPTPEMPEISEAQALLATLVEVGEVKAAIAQRERRVHLQTSYSQAIMFSEGYDAKETKAAFARAAELATRSGDFSARFGVANGQWTTAFMRCEFRTAGELASAFLREAEDLGRLVEVGVARRSLALISYFVGNFLEARTHCEKALDACNPERDREARERFTDDTGTQALSCLAATSWQLGEVQQARELIDAATRRVTEPGHFPSMALSLSWRWFIENKRGDAAAALNAAEALAVLGREHGLSYWRALGEVQAAWARGRLIDPTAGVTEFRRALGAFADQGTRVGVPFYDALLAQLEVETLGPAVALERIENALALADRVEFRCELSFMHRIRGDILCKFDPADPVPQEDAYRRAITIANEQGARSPQLLASLALAKVYQSTGRRADAHAVLAPALEGFSPTPEMPEIAEAQALLVAIEAGAHVRRE